MDNLSLMSLRKWSFSSALKNTHHLCWFSAIRERYCNVVENMYCSMPETLQYFALNHGKIRSAHFGMGNLFLECGMDEEHWVIFLVLWVFEVRFLDVFAGLWDTLRGQKSCAYYSAYYVFFSFSTKHESSSCLHNKSLRIQSSSSHLCWTCSCNVIPWW